jgi:predicted RecB family nuclease
MTEPTIEDLEDAIPDERKNLSFGDKDESVIDVMEETEKEQHHRGNHIGDECNTCPWCPDPEYEHVRHFNGDC